MGLIAVLALLSIAAETHRQSCRENSAVVLEFGPGPNAVYGPSKEFPRTITVRRDTKGCDLHPF
jgi:hypothetical protein